MAIVALGYGDGFSTFYQGASIGEGRIHGRVNMDMAQVFYLNDPKIKRGDSFSIWDNNVDSVTSFSDQTKSIPYELFCSLTNRVPRTYSTEN